MQTGCQTRGIPVEPGLGQINPLNQTGYVPMQEGGGAPDRVKKNAKTMDILPIPPIF